MKALKTIYISIFMALVLCFFNGLAWATPSADFLYLERNIGGGLWQYDYTLFNTSDPTVDVDYDLYYVAIDFKPAATFNLLSLPTGWDEIDGAGFAEAFSLNSGSPPIGTDVAPGTSLGSFSFQFDYQAGNLPFLVYLTNPNDPANPVPFSGTTAPVPEPSTMLLLGAGLAGLVGLRKRFKVKEE